MRFFRSHQSAALLALLVSLVAILQVSTSFALGPDSTYDASSSVTIFRTATLLAILFYGLSFLTRWLVIPGMLMALYGALAMITFLLGPGGESALFVGVAILGLLFALWKGIAILRRPRQPASSP